MIGAINRNPRRILKRQEITQPYYKASRATGPEILKSFRTGNVRKETGKTSRLPVNLNGFLPAQITRGVTHSALDIREHREIKACLKAGLQSLGSVNYLPPGCPPESWGTGYYFHWVG